MKNILEILKSIGIEVTEENKATLEKEVNDNYKTITEVEKIKAKRDELKTELDDVKTQLSTFDGVDVDGFKGQISELTKKLEESEAARKADESKYKLETTVSEFMRSKEFVNSLTAESIQSKLFEALQSDDAKGKSLDDLFTSIVSDKDGKPLPNILVDAGQEQANQNKATFTQPMGNKPTPGGKMDMATLMKMKNENPGFDIKAYLANNQN